MARKNLQDFQRDVSARSTGKSVYASATNTDGTVNVTKNGATLHRIFYAGGGGAITDANPTGDRVIILDPNGVIGIADASLRAAGIPRSHVSDTRPPPEERMTDYITREPMTIAKAKRLSRSSGWRWWTNKESKGLTDGANYAHVSSFKAADGKKHLWVERYGGNDVEELAEILDLVSEYEDEFTEIVAGEQVDA